MTGWLSLLLLACATGVGGIGVLRHAWSLPLRSPVWNAAGWLSLVAAACVGWRAGGAWGTAIVALAVMLAALALLSVTGMRSPRGRVASTPRRTGLATLPREPRHIARRLVTFLLVVPGGLIAAIALALAARGLATAAGWGEANANVTALYTVPLGGGVLAVVLLMQARRTQLLTLLACALAGAPFLLPGLVA